jgi:hypothetical protein
METTSTEPPASEPMTTTPEHEFSPHSLPKEVGVLVMVAGIGGLILPGPVGTPLILVGGVILWPKAFGKLERSFHRRCPNMYAQAMRQLERFLNDLDRRYPLPK